MLRLFNSKSTTPKFELTYSNNSSAFSPLILEKHLVKSSISAPEKRALIIAIYASPFSLY